MSLCDLSLWGYDDVLMLRVSGHAAFLDPDVNKALKKVLNEWGEYLKVRRGASRPVMTRSKPTESGVR